MTRKQIMQGINDQLLHSDSLSDLSLDDMFSEDYTLDIDNNIRHCPTYCYTGLENI